MAAVVVGILSIRLPQDLIKRTEQVASERAMERDKLIQSAVEAYLADDVVAEAAKELEEGYAANADISRRLCDEFSSVDAEGF